MNRNFIEHIQIYKYLKKYDTFMIYIIESLSLSINTAVVIDHCGLKIGENRGDSGQQEVVTVL